MRKHLQFFCSTRFISHQITFLIFIVLLSSNYSRTLSQDFWQDVQESSIQSKGERLINPVYFRSLKLDVERLKGLLKSAPLEKDIALKKSLTIIELPVPDGTFNKFQFVESPVMAEELTLKYPSIKTYVGVGIDDPYASVRFDFTPHGFHAMVRTPKGSYYIDPHNQGDIEHYISYYISDFLTDDRDKSCEVLYDESRIEEMNFLLQDGLATPTGPELRTYRLALAATGEYTTYHGGTVELGLAAVVTAVNRVVGVYETELAIRMILIPNNDILIYTDGTTDPYTNSNGGTMLSENQKNLDSLIGTANYDIGHVFSTGGGGVAYLRSVCIAAYKAGGVTGLSNPIGDPFYIDYVAHEMGHQFGGNHTFNGNTGACRGGQRNASTAYEPGSGSTIMAYAGICAPQNLQMHSDQYFHTISHDEIVAYTNFGSGNGCAVITSTGNGAPSVSVPDGGFVIPINTPFVLTGSATDQDGDSLTFSWEEFDLGPAGDPNLPRDDAPIFRVFNPVTKPSRTFPKLSDLLNNTQTIGEILPSYSRNLKFRLVARDNKPGGGGIDYKLLSFRVAASAGPFKVTYPNSNETLPALSPISVTWDVANTNGDSVKVNNVNILLSVDGGQTYLDTLASNTPNDGSQIVILPDIQTTSARIKVEAVGNIFFDISDFNFTIDEKIPVELISFTAENSTNGVILKWITASETNNFGFSLERSTDNSQFTEIKFIEGKGTTTGQNQYSLLDNDLKAGTVHYRLKQIDFDGTFEYSNVISVDIALPYQYSLAQNHPNPFNPLTKLSFELSVNADVKLVVYNTIGQQVAELVNGELNAGRYEYDFNAKDLSSGIYFYTLNAAGKDGKVFNSTRKMILIK